MQLGEIPLVAAPLGGGPTTPDLVLAAAEAGAFGFLAAGYLTPEALAAELQAVRVRTEEFGVNVFVPERAEPDRDAVLAYRERLLPEAVEAGVDLPVPPWRDDDHWDAKIDLLVGEPVRWVGFTFGLPGEDVVDRLHDAGSEVAITVTDADEARAAEEQGADALVVQAATAGGHRGTFDQRRAPNDDALPDLLRAVGAVTTLPLLGAGGVGTAADVSAALKAGALAVQVGTALLLADEAGTNPTYRAALQDAASGTGYAGTAVTRAFTGRVARGLHNGFMDRHDGEAPPAYPAVHHLTRPLRQHAARAGDPDRLHLWAGTGHRHARTGSAGEILESLLP
jgi:NAD(P)H-dependent flavin oxidoreductase YrpB (nitropropane dioxygenase family)